MGRCCTYFALIGWKKNQDQVSRKLVVWEKGSPGEDRAHYLSEYIVYCEYFSFWARTMVYFIGIEILREIKHAHQRNESFKYFYYLELIKFHVCFLCFIVCLPSQLSRHFRHKDTITSSQNIHKKVIQTLFLPVKFKWIFTVSVSCILVKIARYIYNGNGIKWTPLKIRTPKLMSLSGFFLFLLFFVYIFRNFEEVDHEFLNI